jgi:hypothetical protein
LRVGPIDPKTKAAQVGYCTAYQMHDSTGQTVPTFTSKERTGFSGGFKIPYEQRKAKLGRKIQHQERGEDEDAEEASKNEITKEEIMAQLNLGSSQAAAGMGKHGTGSKAALTKDLIENLEKELDKLRRNEEGIKLRKRVALKGDRGSFDETEEQRQQARDRAVEDEMFAQGNNVIHAGEKRIQVMRHRVGQLDSVKALPYEELEKLRLETAARLKVLEEQYWGKREAAGVTAAIRDKYKSYGSNQESTQDTPEQDKSEKLNRKHKSYGDKSSKGHDKRDRSEKRERSERHRRRETDAQSRPRDKVGNTETSGLGLDEKHRPTSGILKNASKQGLGAGSLAKPRYSTYATDNDQMDDYQVASKPRFGSRDKSKPRSRSKSATRRGDRRLSTSPEAYTDPRQMIYEAKYEKYLANKTLQREHDYKRQSM